MYSWIKITVLCRLMCIAWIQLSSSRDQQEAGSSGSMMPVLTQRLSPLMFQHLQLSHTQQTTLKGLFHLVPTIPGHMEQVTTCF